MKNYRILTKPIILGIVSLLIIALVFTAVKVDAQNNATTDLGERLKQKGVPVIHVIIQDRIPYRIEIALQSSSDDENLAIDDNWNMLLSDRAATLAYRYGPRLSSYKLVVYNTHGDVISSGETFLNPDDLDQQLTLPGKSVVDNATTKMIVLDNLRLGELSLDMIDVVFDETQVSDGQILLIQVSAPDIETINRSIVSFMDSLVRTLDTINNKHGTNIVLSYLKLVHQDKPILIFVRDLEIGVSKGKAIEERLVDDWWPYSSGPVVPIMETPTSSTFPPSSTPYPPPSTPYPAP